MIQYSGKTALITGAGTGIGRATAIRFAGEGMKLILVGRRAEKLEETRALTGLSDAECILVPGDITVAGFAKTVREAAEQNFGGIDVLVNNAGKVLNKTFEETEVSDFEDIMGVNVYGPFMMTKEFLPVLRKSEVPVIVNVASAAGHIAYANQTVYGASKHAVIGMTKSLAKEVYPDGIRVHLVSPGGVNTEMITKVRPDLNSDAATMTQPEDIADMIYFLISHGDTMMIDEVQIHRATKEPFVG